MKNSAPPELDLSALDNTGFLTINRVDQPAPERTFVVLGVARSGTTMVSGALHHLGIDMGMGDKANPVFEDVALSQAMESNDVSMLKSLIADRNARHRIWGWKRPSSIAYLDHIKSHFRNPEYLIVFRDIFAIANRNRISVQSEVITNMEQTLQQYQRLVGFLSSAKRPCVLISYEKAVRNPRRLVDSLSSYVGVTDKKKIRNARNFVRATPGEYLVSSRTWGGMGNLDRVEAGFVSGWALMRESTSPVSVDVWINGEHAGEAVADVLRKDLVAKVHPTGECGFRLVLPDDRRLKEGDVVRVRIKGEVKDVNSSPRTYVGKA